MNLFENNVLSYWIYWTLSFIEKLGPGRKCFHFERPGNNIKYNDVYVQLFYYDV